MIPHVHKEERPWEEQASSPRKEKRTPRPASWWRNRALVLNSFCIVDPTQPNWPAIRLRLFGFVDPFVGGFVAAASGLSVGWLLALLMGLSAFVGAFLLRSWWAPLVAPVVVVIGALLPGRFELTMLLIAVAVPAFLGAALGAALVKRRGL